MNSIMWRVGLFYVGSVVLLALLLPGSVYSADESPFVTVLSKIGVPAAGDVMNLVHGPHPPLHGDGGLGLEVHRPHEPQPPDGGILLTCAVCVLGVGLNFLMPSQAFESDARSPARMSG